MRLKLICVFTVLISLYSTITAQISIKVNDIQDEIVLLTTIHNGKNYIVDTLKVKKENIKIPTSSLSKNTIYSITIPSLEYEKLEFIYENEPFEMVANAKNLLADVEVFNNINTKLLYQDLGGNLELLDSLKKISAIDFDSMNIKESLLNQIVENREKLMMANPSTLWAQLNKMDVGAELPFYGNKAFNEIMSKYNGFHESAGNCINAIFLENNILSSSNLFKRRINWLINHESNQNNDSMIFYMDSIFTTISSNMDLQKYALQIFYERFNTLNNHEVEKAMIHFWKKYFEASEAGVIDMLDKWKFGKLMGMREHSMIGEKLVAFEARDEFFNKITLEDIEGEKRILVFWNPGWQAHWINIGNWQDDFNESGIYNKGFRLIFIGAKNDQKKWSRAVEKLNINDKPNYLNRLNDPVFKYLFDADLKIEFPFSYLIDENGIVIDKFKKDILEYSKYTE